MNWYAGRAFNQEKVISSRGPYRRDAPEFKIQLRQDIRSGAIGRRDAAKKHTLSTNLIQLWLTRYDRGELSTEEAEASVISEYKVKIATLERKVGGNPDSLRVAVSEHPGGMHRRNLDVPASSYATSGTLNCKHTDVQSLTSPYVSPGSADRVPLDRRSHLFGHAPCKGHDVLQQLLLPIRLAQIHIDP